MTHRDRIEAILNAASGWLTGADVARRAALPYKTAIDALCALHNHGRIARMGRKAAARWGRLALAEPSLDRVEQNRILVAILQAFPRNPR